MKVSKYYPEITVVLLWAILSIVAFGKDLAISKSVVDSSNSFGLFIARFGEVPGYLLILISLSIIIGHYSKIGLDSNEKMVIVYGSMLLATIPAVIISTRITSLFLGRIVLALSIYGFCILSFYLNIIEISDFRVKAAQFTIRFTLIVPLLIVLGIKELWGRTRYRDLNSNFSNYTPWTEPQGFTGNHSFPSGHAAMAWVFACSILFIKDTKEKFVALLVSLFWVLAVSWGRIVIGAHYFSDVLFSAGFASLTLIHYYRRQFMPEI